MCSPVDGRDGLLDELDIADDREGEGDGKEEGNDEGNKEEGDDEETAA